MLRREVRPVTETDARALLAGFAGHRLEGVVTTTLSLGLRRGEALGLRWGDVDLDRATLIVRCQLQRLNGAWAFVEPKSKESQRTLPLLAFLVDALHAHRACQLEQRLALGGAWTDHDLVFPTGAGTPMEGRNLIRDFQARLRTAGLRHGAATLLLAQGASAKEIQAILGHSHVSTTLAIYTHAAPDLLRQNAERMQRALVG